MCELALERMPLSMYCTERRRCGKHQDWQCRSLRHLTIRFGGSPCRPGFPQTFKHVSAYFNLHSSDSTIYIYILLNAGFGIYLSFLRTFPQEKHFWNVNFSCFLHVFSFTKWFGTEFRLFLSSKESFGTKITKFRVFFYSTKWFGTDLRAVLSSAEWLEKELQAFSVQWNGRNSEGTNQNFRLLYVLQNNFFSRKMAILVQAMENCVWDWI
jgi:hypothetical protein